MIMDLESTCVYFDQSFMNWFSMALFVKALSVLLSAKWIQLQNRNKLRIGNGL